MSKIDLSADTVASLALGGFAAIVLALVWGGFWAGFTLSTLWGWFIAPVFHLPALTIVQAYGLALTARAVQGISAKSDKSEEFGTSLAKAFFLPPIFAGLMLAVGWVAKSWM